LQNKKVLVLWKSDNNNPNNNNNNNNNVLSPVTGSKKEWLNKPYYMN